MANINYNNLVPLHIDKVTGKVVAAHKPGGTPGGGNSGNVLSQLEIIDGELIATYTNGTVETVGPVGDGSGSGVSIVGVVVNSAGELIVSYSDGTNDNVGTVQGTPGLSIEDAVVDSSGHLILTLSDDSTIDAGLVKGADGASIDDITIDIDGNLVITLTNGDTYNLGTVKGEDGTSVLIELTSNGTHTHAAYLSRDEALGLIDGTVASVTVTSTEIDVHTHEVVVTYVGGQFLVTDISDNHLHGFRVVGNDPTLGHRHEQTEAALSWVIEHNQGLTTALTQVYIGDEMVIPTGIRFLDINTIEVFFNEPQVGFSNTIFFTV